MSARSLLGALSENGCVLLHNIYIYIYICIRQINISMKINTEYYHGNEVASLTIYLLPRASCRVMSICSYFFKSMIFLDGC